MIKKIVEISHGEAEDFVELSWFDRQKPNLAAKSANGVEFVVKTNAAHLHENDILICEDGAKIAVKIAKEPIYVLEFENALDFARCAYLIGNCHQPICLEPMRVVALAENPAVAEIVADFEGALGVVVRRETGEFRSNAHSHHAH